MINNKKILCVITARAGSRGIPMKNVKFLLGKPLFIWSVLAALNSKYIDLVAVSSNCDEVKRHFFEFIGKDYQRVTKENNYISDKLKWIQRPNCISGPKSKNEKALIHAYQYLKKEKNLDFDVIINLQPTSPNRNFSLLDRSIEEYNNGGYDSLLTATDITPFIWQKIDKKWAYTVDKNGCCKRKMRQQFKDSEILWHDCGSIYITETKVLLKTKCRIGKNLCVFPVDKLNSLQIDTEDDFLLIEQMVKIKKLTSLV